MRLLGSRNYCGSTNIYLAIFAALTVLTAFVMFGIAGVESYYTQEKNRANREIQYFTQEHNILKNQLQEIESLAGFFLNRDTRGSFSDISQVKVIISTLVGQIQKVKDKNVDLPTLDFAETKITENEENSITLEKMLYAGFYRIQNLQDELALLQHHRAIIAKNLSLQEASSKEIKEEMNTWMRSLEKNLDEQRQRIETRLTDIKDVQAKVEAVKNEAIQKAKEVEATLQEDKNTFEAQLEQKKGDIRKLQAKKYGRSEDISKQRIFQPEEEKADGTITLADARSKTLYIDLGKDSNVRPGFKFDVYRHGKKATKLWIGRIEVQKVMDKVSMAGILEIKDPMDPMVPGDFIINPLFSKGDPVYVVLAGDFVKMTNADVQKWITHIGAKIESEVGVKTKILIHALKSEQTENYRAASSFGVPLMPEEMLLKYIGD